jgi:hypothetical protein
MEKIKGGFPPIKYCPDIIDTSEKKSENRTRSIASGINRNVNIKQILNNNTPEPLIKIFNDKTDDLDIIDTL